MKEINWNKLKDQAHQIAIDKGWWDTERSIPECFALIHSEVSEALEADRKEKHASLSEYYNDIYYEGFYFEGSFFINIKDTFEDELADIVIRCLDLCGKYEIDIDDYFDRNIDSVIECPKTKENIPGQLCSIHYLISRAYTNRVTPVKAIEQLVDVIDHVNTLARSLDIDLLKHVELKMQFNKTRPYKHGKKY